MADGPEPRRPPLLLEDHQVGEDVGSDAFAVRPRAHPPTTTRRAVLPRARTRPSAGPDPAFPEVRGGRDLHRGRRPGGRRARGPAGEVPASRIPPWRSSRCRNGWSSPSWRKRPPRRCLSADREGRGSPGGPAASAARTASQRRSSPVPRGSPRGRTPVRRPAPAEGRPGPPGGGPGAGGPVAGRRGSPEEQHREREDEEREDGDRERDRRAVPRAALPRRARAGRTPRTARRPGASAGGRRIRPRPRPPRPAPRRWRASRVHREATPPLGEEAPATPDGRPASPGPSPPASRGPPAGRGATCGPPGASGRPSSRCSPGTRSRSSPSRATPPRDLGMTWSMVRWSRCGVGRSTGSGTRRGGRRCAA